MVSKSEMTRCYTCYICYTCLKAGQQAAIVADVASVAGTTQPDTEPPCPKATQHRRAPAWQTTALKPQERLDGYVYQDAREVRNKNSKIFTTFFFRSMTHI